MKSSLSALLAATLAFTAFTATDVSASPFTAYSSHSDSACSSAPKQVAYVTSSDCATSSSSSSCVADASSSLHLAQGCVADPKTRTNLVFNGKPWVQFEIYKAGSSCTSMVSAVGYLADGSCLSVDNGSSSVIAKVHSDKSATVTTYEGTACKGTPVKTNTIAASDLQRTTCVGGLFLAYTSSETTNTTVTAESNKAGKPVTGVGALQAAMLSTLVVATTVIHSW